MNTPSARDSLLLAKVLKITSPYNGNFVNFNIEGMFIRKSFPDITLSVVLDCIDS